VRIIGTFGGRLLGLRALRRAVRSCRARAFRAAVASATDGARSRGRVGPGAATRYRSAPAAGLRALDPRPGRDRDRAGCIFTSRCVGAPSMRSRRRPAGSDVAACAVRAGCSPFGHLPSPLVRPGCGGYWGLAVLTPNMPRSGAHSGPAVRPAGHALKLGRDELWVRGRPARTGLPHEAFPLRLRRTGQARAGPGAVLFQRVLALCGLAVAVCDAVHHRIPPGRAASAPRPLPLRLPTDGRRRGADPR